MSAAAKHFASPQGRQRLWRETVLDHLSRTPEGALGYLKGGEAASEPTALASIALAQLGRVAEARKAAEWLARLQQPNGSLGVTKAEPTPGWPVSLAVAAWLASNQDKAFHDKAFDANLSRARQWLLAEKGETEKRSADVGHNTELAGWSWAAKTHSWLEPTAFAVLALNGLGLRDHARTKEAVRLMEDRLLASGGCNYGNTTVFGRELRAHVQPTGIVLTALAGSAKAAKSVEWLRANITAQTTPVSLAWALIGLRAHNALPAEADAWLAESAARLLARDAAPAKLALLALASVGWPNQGEPA